MNHCRRLIATVVVLAIPALVFGLPLLLSRSSLVVGLAEKIHPRLQGRIQVQSCSFHWLGGISCDGVQYRDPQLNLEVHLPRVRSNKGLLTLVLAPHYLGELTVERPKLVFHPRTGLAQVDSPPAASNPLPQNANQRPVSWWERWRLQLNLQGGRVVAAQSDGTSAKVLAREVNLQAGLAQGTVTYALAFRGQEAHGHFRAQGFVNLPNPGQPFFPSLVSRSTLDIAHLEIEPLLELAAARMPRIPRGKGVLDAACRLHVAGSEQFALEGDTSLRGLELTGGVLGADHPVCDELTFRFQGNRHPVTGWQLTALELHSQPLHLSARGVLDRKRADLTAHGEANLAQLAAQLPHLLAIHAQTSVRQGRLRWGLRAIGPLESLGLKADCTTDRLEVIHAGHPYTWNNPLVLQAEATLNSRGIGFTELRARAPFLTVDGRGGREAFTLEATADLDPLFEELARIFTLDLRAKGRLDYALSTQLLDDDQVRVESRLGIENFELSRSGKSLLPPHPLSVRATVIGAPWFALRDGLHSLRVEGEGWPGTFSLRADDIQAAPSPETAAPANCQINGRLDLQRLTPILRSLQPEPPRLQAGGMLQLEASGQWRRQHLLLDRLKGDITDFVLVGTDVPLFREPRLRLGLEGGPLSRGRLNLGELRIVAGGDELPSREPAFCRIDLEGPEDEVRHLRLESDQGVAVVHWSVKGQPGKPPHARLELQGLGQLAPMTAWARQRGWLGPGLVLAGQARFGMIRRFFLDPGAAETELTASIQNFAVMKGKKPLVSDPGVRLDVRFSPTSEADGAEKITRLGLTTSRFSLTGTGVAHTGENPPRLELQGELRPTPAALTPLAATLVPGDLVIRDPVKGPFLFSGPLRLPLDLSQMILSGRFPVDALRYRGLRLEDVTVTADLNRGLLRLPLTGRMDGGQVDVRPQWQQEEAGWLLTLPPGSQVLRDVPVNRAMTTGLLHLLPPLGCLVQATGTISVTCTSFRLPLTRRSGQADFAVVIDVEKARPRAVQALREVLAVAGLTNQPLRFKERELVCEGWGGSITCAPLRLEVGHRDITITGSMRRNGDLAYRVELPVNEALTRQARVSVFGRFAAVAEISGTRAATLFDQQAFLAGLAAQLTATLPQPQPNQSRQPVPVAPPAEPEPQPSATH